MPDYGWFPARVRHWRNGTPLSQCLSMAQVDPIGPMGLGLALAASRMDRHIQLDTQSDTWPDIYLDTQLAIWHDIWQDIPDIQHVSGWISG